MVIVGEFVGGAALGAAIGVLFDAVSKAVNKSTAFKTLLENIKFSLEILKPVIEKIGDHNVELGLPDAEIEFILAEMVVGAKLVQRASKVSRWNCMKSYYTDQLIELDASLKRLLHLLMVQGVRDAKETLILARKHQDQLTETAKDAKETLVMAQNNTSQLTESVKDGKEALELATKYAEQSARDRKETLVLAKKIKRLLKRMVPTCTNKGKTRHSKKRVPKASRRSGRSQSIETSDLRLFCFAELQAATENFSGNVFGRMTYKGWLDEKTLAPSKFGTGMMVAIKRFPENTFEITDWTANSLGGLSHPNFVKLLGYCCEERKMLLVYEFVQRGSLEDHLFDATTSSPRYDGFGLSATTSSPRHDDDQESTDGEILETSNLKIFSFADLKSATKNFSSDRILGEGGFGRVFKGWVDEKTLQPCKAGPAGTGMMVAVKKLSPESLQGFQEWQSEVDFLGRLSHPNLVKLLGYCCEDKELLLVYEFMQKGSLENHLFRRSPNNEPLSWDIRIRIAIGAARGLAFLHSSENPIIHRNPKPSNILLDRNCNAKISDFGLAKLGPTGGDSHVTTRIFGTYGYAAPEYIATGHLYVKSDVYGFGVVLLEILTGLRAVDTKRPKEQLHLVDWAKPLLPHKRKLKTIMDARMEGQYSFKAALQTANITLKCLAPDPKSRPSMKEVLEELEQVQAIREKPKPALLNMSRLHTS